MVVDELACTPNVPHAAHITGYGMSCEEKHLVHALGDVKHSVLVIVRQTTEGDVSAKMFLK